MPAARRRGTAVATKGRRGPGRTKPSQALIPDEVEIEIESMARFRESKNICLFGPSGHGKTVLAGGCPRSMFLTTEKGLSSAKASGSRSKIMRAFDWEHIIAGMRKADEVLGENDWLILDSGTKMWQLYWRWILQQQNKINPMRSLDVPEIQDHLQYQHGIKRFYDHFLDAKYNTIIIFGEMEIPGEDDEMQFVPHIEGGRTFQVCRYVIGQFDVGLRYSVSRQLSEPGNTVRIALAQPFGQYWAKDRYDALEDYQLVQYREFDAMAKMVHKIERSVA